MRSLPQGAVFLTWVDGCICWVYMLEPICRSDPCADGSDPSADRSDRQMGSNIYTQATKSDVI